MTASPADEQPLPVERAFVVQLHATADVTQARISGRVEHVVSGQARHFHTLKELLTFMARVLTPQAPRRRPRRPPDSGVPPRAPQEGVSESRRSIQRDGQ